MVQEQSMLIMRIKLHKKEEQLQEFVIHLVGGEIVLQIQDFHLTYLEKDFLTHLEPSAQFFNCKGACNL